VRGEWGVWSVRVSGSQFRHGEESTHIKHRRGAQWMSRAVCWQFSFPWGMLHEYGGLMCTVHSGFLGGMLHECGGLMCTARSGNLT